MSRAFIREGEDQNLSDLAPTLPALINYLTRENNGVRVYERETKTNDRGETIYLMSNGFAYCKPDGIWQEYSGN
ncbi:MAG: hypothetical protein HWD62_05140 [Cyclobacteriaceae bacterium]|nr:MAG: hypothetical protein HWD62_05140 [Cyclobacteriaceae bacterium]HNT51072.1 hypothetical protein [Cyclobacteriaceae bacterium]